MTMGFGDDNPSHFRVELEFRASRSVDVMKSCGYSKGVAEKLTTLTETPQTCSLKFPTP